MKRSFEAIVRTMAIAVTLATATFGVVRADEGDAGYSCCGTGSTPLAARCRYTDRAFQCATDAVCAGNGEYRLCCANACELSPEEELN